MSVDAQKELSQDMKPARTQELVQAFQSVTKRVATVNTSNRNIRVVLVSKLKPASDILALHTTQSSTSRPRPIHFGENYTQELLSKSCSLPQTIHWHFIGALQTNKCKTLAAEVRGLWCVSSVDSVKKADGLEKGRVAREEARAQRQKSEKQGGEKGVDGSHGEKSGEVEEEAEHDTERLRVHVQVNTSGEESKSGVSSSETVSLCRHIQTSCPHLQLIGLMTIGAIARSQASTPETVNEDFVKLKEVRDNVCEELGMNTEVLELSMGMSDDFEAAVKQGSDEVRVGSTVFGARPPKGKEKAKGSVEDGAG